TPSGGGAPLTWYTETVRREENLVWWARWSDSPGTAATWFWERVTVGSPTTHTYSISLTNPAAEVYSATFRVELAGKTENDHRIRFALNGTVIGEANWSGKIGHQATLTFPAGIIQAGENPLEIAFLTDDGAQSIYLDRFGIQYQRQPVAQNGELALLAPLTGNTAFTLTEFFTGELHLYETTIPTRPVRLTNAAHNGTNLSYEDVAATGDTYLATSVAREPAEIAAYSPASELLSPTEGADLIVLTAREFFTAVQPLVERRRSQGLRVQLVDVADAYAFFNGGIMHPEAIRSLVAYAYNNWPGPAPRYLLLVGDASSNLKGYTETDYGTWAPPVIPPYLDFIDPDQGEVPVDAYFGDVAGDGLSELAVGRLPVYSPAEAVGVVGKILAYEEQSLAPWMTRTLFVADDGATSLEGFADVLDDLQTGYLPSSVTADTVYIQDYCSPISYNRCSSATQALTKTWGQGAMLLTYAGHGAVYRWGHEPLIFNTEVASLPKMNGYPLILSLDCWDGYWLFPPHYPSFGSNDTRSLGEWATTVLTDRGAIGLFGPAGLGYVSTEKQLAQAMYDGMFNQGVFRLGELTQRAREAISWSYLARTYTLLGDPTLILPGWESLTVTPAALTVTAHSVISLPAVLTVTGATRFGQSFVVNPNWTVATGSLDGWGAFTAPTLTQQIVANAHSGSISVPFAINVVGGEALTLTITPDPLIIGAGSNATLSALGTDQWGNATSVDPTWSSDLGVIDATGLFTAPEEVTTGRITATVSALQASVPVEVQAREVTTVTISPNPLGIAVGGTAEMTATVTDQFGNPLAEIITWSSDLGAIDATGLFTAPLYAVHGWITATVGSVSDRTGVEVQHRIYLPLVLRND
ncbi:MAG: C25 family cysteine peptidase, partial [Chloroflexota bacterium]|nr:C25 family cysteine peptidase [Chloroflexota bacterium]